MAESTTPFPAKPAPGSALQQSRAPFQPANHLEQQIWKAMKGKADTNAFFTALLGSQLYFVNKDNEDLQTDDKGRLVNTTTLHLPSVGYKGQRYLSVFSSPNILRQAHGPKAQFLAIRGFDLFRMARGVDFFLNPSHQAGKIFKKEEIEQLLQDVWLNRSLRNEIPEGFELQALDDQGEHGPLAEDLRTFFRRQPKVDRAFLAELVFPNDNRRVTIVAVDAKGSWDKICQAAAKNFENPKNAVKPPVDFYRLGQQDHVDEVFASATPIYRKA
ncbi:MAG: enhanced serine sensitivity protein SseB C-terminal domain-containing protein [Verrucomicrobiota bacterium JB022]|nr:enhanced serine sensitivity protein SseB C-terminal domain-containing protein [Verrucomicrobiota bacterium JB022]